MNYFFPTIKTILIFFYETFTLKINKNAHEKILKEKKLEPFLHYGLQIS